MSASRTTPIEAPRDRWRDACGAAVYLSFVLIVAHVVCPIVFGIQLPYAGGGAVVLGLGATLGLSLKPGPARLAAAVALLGLVSLRTLSAIRPDLLIAKHGALSPVDGGALMLLILAAVTMCGVASAQQPTSAQSGARG